jgi:hypothetical protein
MYELPSSIVAKHFALERGMYRDQVSQRLYSPDELAALLTQSVRILNDAGAEPKD